MKPETFQGNTFLAATHTDRLPWDPSRDWAIQSFPCSPAARYEAEPTNSSRYRGYTAWPQLDGTRLTYTGCERVHSCTSSPARFWAWPPAPAIAAATHDTRTVATTGTTDLPRAGSSQHSHKHMIKSVPWRFFRLALRPSPCAGQQMRARPFEPHWPHRYSSSSWHAALLAATQNTQNAEARPQAP